MEYNNGSVQPWATFPHMTGDYEVELRHNRPCFLLILFQGMIPESAN